MEWMEMLDVVLKAILIPLLPLLGLWAKTWINEQVISIKDKNEREYFNYHLDKANELIITSVKDIKGVYVDLLKKEDAFTKERQVEAFNLAKEKVMAQLTLDAKEVLEKTYVDYQKFIESKIEELVDGI